MKTKVDIQSREDIVELVKQFYNKVNLDPILSPYFNEAAKIDWDHHLPKMYDFWETVLFGKAAYAGNPLDKHRGLHLLKQLTPEAFKRWLELFNETIDENFKGKIAERAHHSATTIAQTLQSRII